jgi:hypothetical protein
VQYTKPELSYQVSQLDIGDEPPAVGPEYRSKSKIFKQSQRLDIPSDPIRK